MSSKLNRNYEKRSYDQRPQLSDLRESGAIEYDADTVLLLYRDELHHPNSETPGMLEVQIAKQWARFPAPLLLRIDEAGRLSEWKDNAEGSHEFDE